MAASLPERAERRAALAKAAMLDALAEGNPHQALNIAIRAMQSEAAKLRRRRRGDSLLADAELAGSLAAIAARLYAHKPRRPAGCPRMPGPADLSRVFEASHARASEGVRDE